MATQANTGTFHNQLIRSKRYYDNPASPRTTSMKELFSKAYLVLRRSPALLASAAQVCLRIVVFAAIVLWPEESW